MTYATAKGQVYSMGKGDLFNFGAGSSYLAPQRVEALWDVFPSQVACGYTHSLVLDNAKKAPFTVPWNISPPPKYQPPGESKKVDTVSFKRKNRILDYSYWDKLAKEVFIEQAILFGLCFHVQVRVDGFFSKCANYLK
jgi:hypothetical protein